jgi:glycosyltransferase involved in cell wall biosynthesis
MTSPIRVLELRSACGAGGGPDKTILAGAAASDSRRFAITVCYLRDRRDAAFTVGARAGHVDFVTVDERHSFDLGAWPALVRLVHDRRIDVVHAHDYKTDLLALALARRTGIVPLTTVHNWCGRSLRERLLYYPADKRLMRFFPVVVAVSSPIQRELRRFGVRPDRIRLLPNGVDADVVRRDDAIAADARADLGATPGDVVVGAVGRLEAEKRFDLLLDAVAALTRRGRRVRLVILGEGSARAQLEAIARARGIADVCSLPGYCPEPTRLSQAFDVFVQSSDDEGTSNAVLEAMALEVPIVATAVGGTADLVSDRVHALLVPARDVGALATAIERTVDEADATRSRVRRARERVEGTLSFAARNRALESIYEELMVARIGAKATARIRMSATCAR